MPRSNGIRVSFPNILFEEINRPQTFDSKKIISSKLSFMIQTNPQIGK